MCVGVPMRLLSVDGIAGRAAGRDGEAVVDLSLTPDAAPGDHVLVFLGAAREIVAPAEAARIEAALAGLAALMAGGDLGDAFADLEARTPELPPHLEAARIAGRTTA